MSHFVSKTYSSRHWIFSFFPFFQHQEAEIEELFRTQDDLQAKYNDELKEKKVKYYPINFRLCKCLFLDCVTLYLNLHCRVGMLIQFMGRTIVSGHYAET